MDRQTSTLGKILFFGKILAVPSQDDVDSHSHLGDLLAESSELSELLRTEKLRKQDKCIGISVSKFSFWVLLIESVLELTHGRQEF